MGLIWTIKLDFHKNLTQFVDKLNAGGKPTEAIYESVADAKKKTNVDIPDIL